MDYHRYPCIGCHDGYFIEHLIHYYQWKYAILPILNLSSIIFHGPSVLWCIASGGVWLDHRDINQARCFARTTLKELRRLDNPIALTMLQRIKLSVKTGSWSLLLPSFLFPSSLMSRLKRFDWQSFDSSANKICLRMNEFSFLLSKF